MFARSLALGVSITAIVLLPAACGSFSGETANPGTQTAEGGQGGEGGAGSEGGPLVEGGEPDAPAPDSGLRAEFVLAHGYSQLRGIAATETDVYFIDQAPGGVHTVPIGGGLVRDLSVGGTPSSIALGNGFVYWSDVGDGTVQRTPLAGGTIDKSASIPPAMRPSVIAAGTSFIFGLVGSTANDGQIQQFGLDLQAIPLNTVAGLTNPFSLSAYGDKVYWTEAGGSNKVVAGQGGMSSSKTLSAEADCELIASDAAGVYWTRPNDGLIRAFLGLGPAGAVTLATGETGARAIAADGTNVYWTTTGNELRRVGHIPNSTPSTLATNFKTPADYHVRGIAVTNAYVVWVTEDGKVLRLAK